VAAEPDYAGAIRELSRARSVVFTTHVKPDGDGLGSIAALRRWLIGRGKKVGTIVPTPPSPKYAFLDPDGTTQVAGRDVDLRSLAPPDLVCVVDTGTWLQLAGMEPLVAHSGAPVLVIDHHQTWDALADVPLIDPSAVAAAVMVHRLLAEAGAEMDPTTAMYLLTGLAVDTDWFRLPTVDAATLRLAASLVEAGAPPAEIYDRLYMSDDFARAQLRGRAIETIHPALDGRAMVMRLTQGLFREVGADIGDTENLINECMRIRGVQVGLMLVEAEGEEVRISLRSRPPVDILPVAKQFGGGGHHRAAGATCRGPMDRVEAEVLALVAEALADADAGSTAADTSKGCEKPSGE